MPVSGDTPTPDSTAAALKETLEKLNALDAWLTDAEKRHAELIAELQEQDYNIADLNRAVDASNTKLAHTAAEIAKLRTQQDELETKRLTQAELIREHVGAAYRLTGQDFLKQLLNQESPEKFERMIRYHRTFSETRLEALAEYQDTLARLETVDEALQVQQERERSEQSELLSEQETLTNERGQRAEVIAQLDAERETRAREYERLQQDRVRLEQLLAELRRRAQELDGSAFVAARGNLPMPVTGRIRHAFGSKRADGRLIWHGIDIAAPEGSPVTAIFRGRVIFSDWLRGFGFLTVLDHGSNYMTLYGHADVLYKKEGDWVESGELIATAGNSGGRPDPGLYFEVRHKGDPQDPIIWVQRR